jgi:hypothetical protein
MPSAGEAPGISGSTAYPHRSPDAGVGGRGEGDVSGDEILDVDVEVAVGVGGIEVGGERVERDLGSRFVFQASSLL